ncbi:hypothetical protein [Rhizobium sp. BG4]|uniref:hypothetical protein n=1 Tax=Rhizobium sp. BG4 TaxID=2613770 RepID=UPI00193E3ADB|nr:hypothetical protein [Rhizobium sp. BG4]QRM45853.1 hypothetical protein F2982_20735 [Rhizobium sp. BG4]
MTTLRSTSEFEPDYHKRRIQTKGQSYPIAVSPRPEECLEDLLIRAACENGFPPILSYKLLGVKHKVSGAFAPGPNRFGITAETLSILLGNPAGPKELRFLLNNTPPPEPHLRPFFDVWLDSRTLSAKRRLSPLALRKAPFLRSIWRVWPINFDPDTKETLLSTCPVCQKSIASGFMGDVWCCDRCIEITSNGELKAVDLRDFPQPIVDEHLWYDLDFATSFVDPAARDRRRTSRSLLHADFGDLSDGEIFEAIFAFARLVSKKGPTASRFELTATELARAADVIRCWPTSFESLVMEWARTPQCAPSEFSIRALANNGRISIKIRRRIREIVWHSTVRKKFGADQAATYSAKLGSDFEVGLVERINRTRETEGVDVVDAQFLRTRPDVRRFNNYLGISVPTFMALADSGFLPVETFNRHDGSLFTNARATVSRLLEKSLLTLPTRSAIRLPRAVSAFFAGPDDPWSTVLQGLLSGEVEFWHVARPQSSILEGIYIDDVAGLRRILIDVPKSREALYQIPLSIAQAGRHLRLGTSEFLAAERAGLLNQPATWESIARFRAEYEPTSVLSVRCGSAFRSVTTQEMLFALKAEGIQPVLNYYDKPKVWRRTEVERFFGDSIMPRVK